MSIRSRLNQLEQQDGAELPILWASEDCTIEGLFDVRDNDGRDLGTFTRADLESNAANYRLIMFSWGNAGDDSGFDAT